MGVGEAGVGEPSFPGGGVSIFPVHDPLPVGGDGFRHQAGVVSVEVRAVGMGGVGEFSGATRQKSCQFIQEVVFTLLEAVRGEEVL